MKKFSHSLDPFFRPQSVAVVGASATPGAVGSILMRNLMENPFGGVVYPINPKRHAVHGVYCYPNLKALPEVVDLAVIATPAATVPGMVKECAELGIPAAIIISAGFSELGEKGRQLEAQIRDIARGKVRLIGPNCLGVIHPGNNFNASFASAMARPGRVALLSQSGAICTSILDWSKEKHVGFSGFVSVGAMADVDFADLLDYFGDDPNTRSIVLYMESVGNVRKFLSAARAVARSKQVILVKAGRHEAGARAAASHTGSLAGSDDVFDAAVRRAGVLRVDSIPDLFNMAELLALQPPPRGPALAIITNAGGPGVMATDALMLAGGELAAISADTKAALDAALPPFWSHANPIDVLGDATPQRYRQTIEICAKDPNIQGLLVLLTPQAMTDPTETARQIVPFAKIEGKPILAAWMGGAEVREGKGVLGAAGIPAYDSPEAAIEAFLHMVSYRRNQDLLYQRPPAMLETAQPDQAAVRAVIAGVRAAGRTLLSELEAKRLLAAYCLPVVPTEVASTADEAVKHADKMSYPVVAKLWSDEITHKSDAGGVQLNLENADMVRHAFGRIRANALSYAKEKAISGDVFRGVSVQPMVQMKGYELIVGSSLDVQFGPTILFGAGGILVEIFKDRALGLPPLNRALAQRLIERTKIAHALRGVRGQKPVPMDKLEEFLVRFSYLLCDFREIQEIDINPLLASPDGLMALDARVLLAAPEKPPVPLAIEPYPNQYTTAWKLKDGSPIVVRAIRPEDEPLIVELHAAHSERTIRMRFFSMVKEHSRDSLIRLCHIDYAREMALVAESRRPDGTPFFLGVARYCMDPESREGEFAIVINDRWQGQGLGQHLMKRLIEVARERGVKKLVGSVLRENAPMLKLVQELGFTVPHEGMGDVAQVTLTL